MPKKRLIDTNKYDGKKYTIGSLICSQTITEYNKSDEGKKAVSKRVKQKHAKNEIWDTAENRFWKSVDKRGEDDCWNIIGSSYKKEITIGKTKDKKFKRYTFHRFSLILHGIKSNKPCVVNVCKNKMCVNPKHLVYMTFAEIGQMTKEEY